MSQAGGFAEGTGFRPCHAPEEEYRRFVLQWISHPSARNHRMSYRARFMRAYPDLEDWLNAPLWERVGQYDYHGAHHRHGCKRPRSDSPTTMGKRSYQARPYLLFLGLHGYARFDLEWLIAVRVVSFWQYLEGTGLQAGFDTLLKEARELGYAYEPTMTALKWSMGRIYLHTGNANVNAIGGADLNDLEGALLSFGARPDAGLFFDSVGDYRKFRKQGLSHLRRLSDILYHRGQLNAEPRRNSPARAAKPVLKPRMEAVMERYVNCARLIRASSTVSHKTVALRDFITWIHEVHPEVESFADVARGHVLEYAEALTEKVSASTGRPLAPSSRRSRLQDLAAFFRETAEWEWEEVPGRPLLGRGDLPKVAERVPRYIPEEELPRLMDAIRALEDPYPRAALLVARWSGARRGEIRRLELDCLDAYPDGTPRLRIPAGKTLEERMVPLTDEAAQTIRQLQSLARPGRGLRDPCTGKLTQYLFTKRGRLLSHGGLFDNPLRRICEASGALTAEGKCDISPHRFRHTVGTQMAEGGARISAIMSVLGHRSANMTMVYAKISDREVLKDYEAVLRPGAAIAGPLAETLRSGELPASDVEWIKQNFFKTELELGHCLRLPQEGPCECDLYLNCSKFVTTKEYAPRLRARRRKEFELIDDAISNGWEREAERHRCALGRVEQLLRDLGEPLEEEEETG